VACHTESERLLVPLGRRGKKRPLKKKSRYNEYGTKRRIFQKSENNFCASEIAWQIPGKGQKSKPIRDSMR
jgi:hypothetical protein